MKAVIFTKEHNNYKKGDIFFLVKSEEELANFKSLFESGVIISRDISPTVDRKYYQAENLVGVKHPRVPRFWSKAGFADQYVDPLDPSFTEHPEVESFWEVVYKPTFKTPQVDALYSAFLSESLAKMAETFGTSNPESATAYEKTWALMAATPSDWSSLNLTSRFTRGTFLKGDLLDTNLKITTYALESLTQVKLYGIWRMQRIQQFRLDRDTILAS